MSNEQTAVEPDPLKSIADAMEAAVEGTKEGMTRASEAVENMLPQANDLLSRFAYKTCYAISYGVVFPCVMIARSVPQNNAMVHGFIDGSRAARDMVDEIKSKSTQHSPASVEGSHAT